MIGFENTRGFESTRPAAWSQDRADSRRAPAFLPLRVLWFGLTAPLLLRRPPERLADRLETAAPRPVPQPGLAREAGALVRRIDVWLRAGWPLIRRGCLTRGVTQLHFLRRAGFPVSLRFGMGEIDGRVEGHCWLVLDGEPLGERRDPRAVYTEMWRIPRE
jgi:hypothetical protein